MVVNVEEVISLNVVGRRRFDLLSLSVQRHRVAYDSEDWNIVDPIAHMSASRQGDSSPCAIFS